MRAVQEHVLKGEDRLAEDVAVSEGLAASIPYLRGYWERTLMLHGAQRGAVDLDDTMLSGLRLNVRETLQYLHGQRPALEEFEAWIAERNGGRVAAADVERLRRAMEGEVVASEVGSLADVEGLTAAELVHWDEHGYVVLKNAVTKAQARAAELAIYEYLAMDPGRPGELV